MLPILFTIGCASLDQPAVDPVVDQQKIKYDQMIRSVVKITMTSDGSGSGVVVRSDSSNTYILSKHHVTRNEEQLKVIMNDSEYDATLIREDIDKDLSLLQIVGHTDYVANLGNYNLEVFDEIYAVGLGQENKVYPTYGIVSNPTGKDGLIQFSAHTVPGMSGGGLFVNSDDKYLLVGIVEGIGLTEVVLKKTYYDILTGQEIKAEKYVTIPSFGIGRASNAMEFSDFLNDAFKKEGMEPLVQKD